jgi:hypothetical protein
MEKVTDFVCPQWQCMGLGAKPLEHNTQQTRLQEAKMLEKSQGG